jgi:uncharacterized protein YggE
MPRKFVMPAAIAAALLASPLALSPLVAQEQPMRPTPQIVVSANGEVQVTPDRARVMLGVETEAPTAQAASQQNAELQGKVIAALRAAGIPQASIRTTGFNVAPKQENIPETRKWRVDGYRVTNLVVVTVDDVSRTGQVIDAALGVGANRVAGLNFEIRDPSAAREEAIRQAVERARREANIAAVAAGGSIAGLLEINVNTFDMPQPRPMMEMAMRSSADEAPTPISEGSQAVTVNVTTRWEYRATP